MSFSCSGHTLEGGCPLTRESSALAVEFMHSKKTFKNADPAVFSWRIYNHNLFPLAYWIPACAGMTIFSSFPLYSRQCTLVFSIWESPLHENDSFYEYKIWHSEFFPDVQFILIPVQSRWG